MSRRRILKVVSSFGILGYVVNRSRYLISRSEEEVNRCTSSLFTEDDMECWRKYKLLRPDVVRCFVFSKFTHTHTSNKFETHTMYSYTHSNSPLSPVSRLPLHILTQLTERSNHLRLRDFNRRGSNHFSPSKIYRSYREWLRRKVRIFQQ